MSCVRSAGYILEELVDVLGLCGPAGADAHRRVAVVNLLPNGKEVFGAKPVELLVAEDWKLLVGGAVDEEWYALPPPFLASSPFSKRQGIPGF